MEPLTAFSSQRDHERSISASPFESVLLCRLAPGGGAEAGATSELFVLILTLGDGDGMDGFEAKGLQ